MRSQRIQTNAAPKAVGPYSQGVRGGAVVFTSGQLPMTPAGDLVQEDAAGAARQALENVRAVLKAGGAEMKDVVKVTIYLTDMADFREVNGVYAEYFDEPFPARSCIAVARLPLDARLEIEAVAIVP
jgi:2-iminobutanoate/2-iminopropanoate deaminase